MEQKSFYLYFKIQYNYHKIVAKIRKQLFLDLNVESFFKCKKTNIQLN